MPPGKKPGAKDRKTEQAEMEAFKKYLESALANIPELARLKEHVKIEVRQRGAAHWFDRGSQSLFSSSWEARKSPRRPTPAERYRAGAAQAGEPRNCGGAH